MPFPLVFVPVIVKSIVVVPVRLKEKNLLSWLFAQVGRVLTGNPPGVAGCGAVDRINVRRVERGVAHVGESWPGSAEQQSQPQRCGE